MFPTATNDPVPQKRPRAGRLGRWARRLATGAIAFVTLLQFGCRKIDTRAQERQQQAFAEMIQNILDGMYKTDTVGIAGLRDDFGRSALGRQLLDMADSSGVTIVNNYDFMNYGSYTQASRRMALRKHERHETRIAVLAHELYHAAQHHRLGGAIMSTENLSPRQTFAVKRLLEGSAFAFEAYFIADRIVSLNLSQPEADTLIKYAGALAMEITPKIVDKLRTGGLSAEWYRANVLLPGLRHISEKGYSAYNDSAAELAALKSLRPNWQSMSDSALVDKLRHVGGIAPNAPFDNTSFGALGLDKHFLLDIYPYLPPAGEFIYNPKVVETVARAEKSYHNLQQLSVFAPRPVR